MKRPERILRLASVLALVGLVLMGASVLAPMPILVVGAMTVGQVVGALSLGLYVVTVLHDLVQAKVLAPPGPTEAARRGSTDV